MSLKTQSSQSSQSSRIYFKKLFCSEHGSKLVFKCDYQHCPNPFICSSSFCLEGHFHPQNEGKLVLARFNSSDCFKKFGEVQRIFTKEDFAVEAKQLKSFIDELKLTMVSIYKDYKDLHSKKEALLSDLGKPFEISIMDKVDQTITLGHNLRKTIDTLKSKVNIPQISQIPYNAQSDENGSRLVNGFQSPLYVRSQTSEKKSLNQSSQKNLMQKSKQYEQGEVVFENPKQNSSQMLIQLQVSIDSNHVSEENHKHSGHSNKILESNSKANFSGQKDNFEELFQNGPFKSNHKDSSQLISVEKGSIASSSAKMSNQPNSNSISNSLNSNGLSESNSPLRASFSANENYESHQSSSSNINLNYSQHLKIYERAFLLKKELTIFLEKNIKNFSWGLCQQIYSSYMPLKPIEKFHEMLQGKRSLLFVFIGQNRIIGSYYPSRYPRLTQKLRNDPNSFLFISNNEKTKLLEYCPVSSEFHLSISDKLYICHGNTPSYADGIRTFQKNFEGLNYCLPSVSYKYQPQQGQSNDINENKSGDHVFNGILKVKQFFVLQVLTQGN